MEGSSGVKMATDIELGLHYWLRWQVPVCALIFIVPAIVAVVLVFRERGTPVSSADLWIPCWRRLHPLWLLGYRVLVVFLMSYILLGMMVDRILGSWGLGAYGIGFLEYPIDHGYLASSFCSAQYPLSLLCAMEIGANETDCHHHTWWTFALVILYFVLGVVISAHGYWMFSRHHIDPEEAGPFLNSELEDSTPSIPFTGNKVNGNIKLSSQGEQEEKERVAGFWGYLMQILYQTCAGAVVLTDIVFWFMIVPFLTNEHFKLNMLMGCMHTLNAVFLVIDTAVNSLPFPLFGSAYFVLWSCIYVIFQWILHACGFTWWPYPFLELATPWAPAWYLCLALIHIPCYGLYSLIVKAKHLFFPKLFPNAYIQSC